MEQIECSKTSAYKIQTPGNHPEENILQEFPFVYNISNMFWLLGKAIIRLNHYKVQKYKCFIFLYLIIFQPADSCGKNPKYVDYCKKN
jgi:hypothetical protein